MSTPRRAHRFTPGRMTGRLGATCGLLLFAGALLGISECSATCTDPVTGEKYKCTRCESVDQNACTEDLWYLDGWGTECLEGDRPEADDGTVCANGLGMCQAGGCLAEFPCTEQGILDAIATGGGPHTFDCDGPTTVASQAEILIDNDVILDGEGELTVQGSGSHRIFSVTEDTTASLFGFTITGGFWGYGDYGSYEPPPTGPHSGNGAGIFNEGVLAVQDSLISGNGYINQLEDKYAYGGGVWSGGSLTLSNVTIRGNAGDGGGIVNYGDVEAFETTISSNQAYWGPGAIDNYGRVTLTDSRVLNNDGEMAGIWGGTVHLIRTTVSGNGGVLDGPANIAAADLTIIDSFVGLGRGGVGPINQIAIRDSLTVVNSTIEGRDDTWPSSLIEARGSSVVRIINSTLIAAYFTDTYRIIDAEDLVLRNTILVGECDPTSNVVSEGGNIETGDTCGLDQQTDQANVTSDDLKLGPLQNNGGPTETHALLPGSVAIDQIPAADCVDAEGAPLTTDQRGVARPQGSACDVGAVEKDTQVGPTSDDFFQSNPELKSPPWIAVDPVGDCTQTVTNNGVDYWVEMQLPGGSVHDPWDPNTACQLLQNVDDLDFEMEAKWFGPVPVDKVGHGFVVKDAAGTFIRANLRTTGVPGTFRLQAFYIEEGVGVTTYLTQDISAFDPSWLKLGRVGDQWTFSYSTNGANWTPAAIFTQSLTVTQAGLVAMNIEAGGAAAYDAKCDYFFNTASPISP